MSQEGGNEGGTFMKSGTKGALAGAHGRVTEASNEIKAKCRQGARGISYKKKIR